jgi:probable F420-dependent oxidoreductase
MMQLGACFPTNEIGNDPAAIRDWAQAAEQLGYDFVEVYDHVLSADPVEGGAGRRGSYYTLATPWHEPLVTLGFLAAVTSRVRFLTGILVLPQRQTALAAKQLAEIDILSGGRMMLGIGTGWSDIEYRALGQDFHTRGRRSEEQIRLLRLLWTEPLVDFEGEFDRIEAAGINPRPARPIPIWLGGHAPSVLDRIGRLADGWVVGWSRPEFIAEQKQRVAEAARAAGRDPTAIGIETRSRVSRWTAEEQAAHARRCEEAGATHFALHTLEGGLTTTQAHIEALRAFADAYRG